MITLSAAALMLPAGAYCADRVFPPGAAIAVSRTPDHLYIAPGIPIVVQVTVANNTGQTLRGFYYVEHVPSVFGVETIGVSIDGAPVLDYDYEVSIEDIYPHTKAYRWIVEEPGRYVEMDNPLTPGSVLAISYRVTSPGNYSRSLPPYFFACERQLPSAEYYFGYCDETLLVNPDTDGDGFSDGHEMDEGSDHLDDTSHPPVVAVVKETAGGDQNFYLYDASKTGDRTYGDAVARNNAPFARDLWFIPAGNGVAALALVDIGPDGRDELAVVRKIGGDQGLFLYNLPLPCDTTYWDAAARNPSPLARDFWFVPSGNAIAGLANAGDVDADGREDLAVLKNEGGDHNLYVFSAPAAGDWTYWDASSRNPSPLARDLWCVPGRNDTASFSGVDADGDGDNDYIASIRRRGGDRNLFLWRIPEAGDWTYFDAVARQDGHAGAGTPQARDLWAVVSGNSVASVGGAETGGAPGDELFVMKNEDGDHNFYVYALPVPGDWTYWDAVSRNPSPLARDLWVIPYANTTTLVTAN